jgi:hypothetical protein
MLAAIAEAGLIVGVTISPIYNAARDALDSMGDSVEQDVAAGDDA